MERRRSYMVFMHEREDERERQSDHLVYLATRLCTGAVNVGVIQKRTIIINPFIHHHPLQRWMSRDRSAEIVQELLEKLLNGKDKRGDEPRCSCFIIGHQNWPTAARPVADRSHIRSAKTALLLGRQAIRRRHAYRQNHDIVGDEDAVELLSLGALWLSGMIDSSILTMR